MVEDKQPPDEADEESNDESVEEDHQLASAVDDLASSAKRIGSIIRKEFARPARIVIERGVDRLEDVLSVFEGDEKTKRKRK